MEQLRQTLNELHNELSQTRHVDPDVRNLLEQISEDINSLLVTQEAATTSQPLIEEKEGLLDRMLGLTEQFEESHPELANVLGRIASALSRIGI